MDRLLNGKYTLRQEIGCGSFSRVFKAVDLNGRELAIKRLKKAKIEGNDYFKKALDSEIEIMKMVSCDNSVLLVDYFETKTYFNIVMEVCERNLDEELKKREKPFSEEELKLILKQLSKVFVIMDKENIMHRDIKLANILVKIDTRSSNKLGFIVKLTDFGLSKVMETDITATFAGTYITMAPEVLERSEYSAKADLWSVGVICYQLLYNSFPFNASTNEDLLRNIKTKEIRYPSIIPISKNLKQLLNKLLSKDPVLRYSWKELIYCDFLEKERDKELEIEKKFNDLKLDCERKLSARTNINELKIKKEVEFSLESKSEIQKKSSKESKIYFSGGIQLYNQKKYKDAEKYFQKSIELDSTYCNAYNFYGLSLYYQNRLDEAEKYFLMAIELDSTYCNANTSYGILLYNQKKYKEAEPYYLKSIELDSTNSKHYYNYGLLLYCLKKFDEAEKYYKKAIALDSTYINSYYNYGLLLFEQKRYEEAEEYYKKTIQIDTNNSNAYNNYGYLLDVQKRYREAEKCYKKALTIDPKNSNAEMNLNNLHTKMQKKDEEVNIFSKVDRGSLRYSYTDNTI